MNTTGFSALNAGHWAVSPTAGNGLGNSTYIESSSYYDLYIDWDKVHLVTVLICLLGLVGNGAVIWLLGFRLKRNPFSVYILNLAVADVTFLLVNGIWAVCYLLPNYIEDLGGVIYSAIDSSSLVSLSLLMAVSTECCVSVLCPLWYRCHRPAHLSCTLCALIWGVGSCSVISVCLCFFIVDVGCPIVFWFYCVTPFLTSLVLCVSSLTLFIRVQCSSRRRQPSRFSLTILLSVLAFLLLRLPHNVLYFVLWLSPDGTYIDILFAIARLLLVLNSAVNPVIYFFVGRLRQPGGRKPLREVLQRAVTDEEEEAEQDRGVPVPSQDSLCP
ncbi:mas-related G-protein coupled receptor member A2-like [Erinaceus europaeus]|uniref:Mas-related G-protein coupled receptor member A2-like n=1 Tax=Erinaceus europaeus TaxID=9365 RepID=A0ABM3WA10_ERIEU|nr:mas-related G-protein coupled receptor member A2-like [Erinaceus europaeus]